ncbi:MAG: hypothetical protein ACREIL_03725 [Nitrospiraceae bacterium]
MRHVCTLAVAPLLLLVLGCAKAPTDKLAAAEQAVNEARTAGAADYMAEDFAKIEGMLGNAKTEISQQDAKVGVLRDYEKAEQLLVAAQTESVRVMGEVGRKKEEVKAAAVQAHLDAQAAVKTAQQLVAKAPVGKDRAALEAIKADVRGLSASLTEVSAALEAGDYKAAQSKAKAIQDKSQSVSAEIQSALAKTGAAKAQKSALAKKK